MTRQAHNIVFKWLVMCLLSFAAYGSHDDFNVEQWLNDANLLEQHTPVLMWIESAPEAPDVRVAGCRLVPANGAWPFDVYFDAHGTLLGVEELAALGISEKHWEDMDVDVPAVVVDPAPQPKVRPADTPFRKMEQAPLYVLDPLDHAVLLDEDARYDGEYSASLIRYGVNRRLEPPVMFAGGVSALGALQMEDSGAWQWEWQLQSAGALGIRMCFDELLLPPGVEVYVYNPGRSEEYFGPIMPGSSVWTPSVISDTIGIICRGDSIPRMDEVRIEINRIIHVYRSPVSLEKALGDCHRDIVCRPEWEPAGTAVGRLGMVTYDAWACTGALIVAPGYESLPPFMLTANHCINNQVQADTLEVWWLYQKAVCGEETVPDTATLPRSTGGARFLVGAAFSDGSDFSLLLLYEPPPVQTAYLGYTTRLVSPGESVVCIHHPQGLEKRISFGSASATGSPRLNGQPLAPYETYHEIVWLEGSTEAGSSGSPLMLEETSQIIGQLYGGYASCSVPAEPDYFGRMDSTYPLIEPWLSGASSIEGEGESVEGEGEPEGEGEQEGEGEDEKPKCCCRDKSFSGMESAGGLLYYMDNLIHLLLPLSGLFLAYLLFGDKKQR